MNLEQAKELLSKATRDELRDHAFGDCEVTWTDGKETVAEGGFGLNSTFVTVHTTFVGEDAAALRQIGIPGAVERNDSTGPDEYQEGVCMPGLTEEGVLEELTTGRDDEMRDWILINACDGVPLDWKQYWPLNTLCLTIDEARDLVANVARRNGFLVGAIPYPRHADAFEGLVMAYDPRLGFVSRAGKPLASQPEPKDWRPPGELQRVVIHVARLEDGRLTQELVDDESRAWIARNRNEEKFDVVCQRWRGLFFEAIGCPTTGYQEEDVEPYGQGLRALLSAAFPGVGFYVK